MNIQIDIFKESGKWLEDRISSVNGDHLFEAVEAVSLENKNCEHPYILVTVLGSHAKDQIGLSRLIVTKDIK